MAPIIKLIHDDATGVWICGDEKGEIVLVTDEFAEDAIDAVWSKTLRAFKLSHKATALHVPILDESSCKASFGAPTWTRPTFGEHLISTKKGVIKVGTNKYNVRLGFSQDVQMWVHQWLYTEHRLC